MKILGKVIDMNTKVFHMSVQGANHIKHDKVCQDASVSYVDDKMAIAIICDGHGGDDYMRSDIGSKMAAQVGLKNIKEFIESITLDELLINKEQYLHQLKSSIIAKWRYEIERHARANMFRLEELEKVSEKARGRYEKFERIHSAYGTTFIAVAITSDYWFGMQIGDGRCVAVNQAGEFKQPVPIDEKCFLNATTSICDSDALNSFHHFFSRKLPIAAFVGSDGVDDSFKNDEQLYQLYKAISYSFTTTEFDIAKNDLYQYLPKFSEKGSGDDVSIAAVLDIEALREAEFIKSFSVEAEKKRIAENARLEAEKYEAEKKRIESKSNRAVDETAAIETPMLEELHRSVFQDFYDELMSSNEACISYIGGNNTWAPIELRRKRQAGKYIKKLTRSKSVKIYIIKR